MKENKKYRVTIELDEYEVIVSATSKTEAIKKATARLDNKKPSTMIRRSWPDNRRDINVEEGL